jgi:murein DD-endopeptidase MepM/ murein hydrolase activator NlpD
MQKMAKDKYPDPLKKTGLLKNRYRLTVYNDTTLEQVWQFRISGLGAIVSGSLFIIVLIATVTLLIAFTGLREFIPGYPDTTTREKAMSNTFRIDSLEKAIVQWERQLENINLLLQGKEPLPIDHNTRSGANPADNAEITAGSSREDSLLRQEIEDADRYNPSLSTQITTPQSIENLFLFPPVQGVVTDAFDVATNHLAVDIVSAPHAPVMSVLDGSVIMAGWLPDTGNVIQIQHDNNIISVYKHNEKLLKRQGDRVKAGEVIAIVGNSGELTTGAHLHFELWHKGSPVDPLKYINFNVK